jgi:hypothetical protein
MQVAIFAEGPSDAAVLSSILKGKLGINRADIDYRVPELDLDESDLYQMRINQFSNWTIVKQHCIEQTQFNNFFNSTENAHFAVIQLDTAERHLIGYDVSEPTKTNTPQYSHDVRANVIGKINEWLDNQYTDKLAYAITIEETESWLLTLYELTVETSKYNKPKERFWEQVFPKFSLKDRNFFKNQTAYQQHLALSKGFCKKKILVDCCNRNLSLNLFYESLNVFESSIPSV